MLHGGEQIITVIIVMVITVMVITVRNSNSNSSSSAGGQCERAPFKGAGWSGREVVGEGGAASPTRWISAVKYYYY